MSALFSEPQRSGGLPMHAWLMLWRLMRRYHRYEVRGLTNLQSGRAALLVGYHGRPIAYDLCMLSVTLFEKFGHLPHGVVHRYVEENRLMKWVADDLGFITNDGAGVDQAVARGELLLVQPGGTREGCRSHHQRYRVDWGDRLGYLRLALRHGLPIVPVVASGIDDGYIGLNDGYALGKRLGMPGGLPLWFGVGLTGFFPFSPPFPIKIVQYIGAPIVLPSAKELHAAESSVLIPFHRQITSTIQSMLDEVNP
jgi:1-acyl-sn-glycerol-3-phosphate acyltransferase